MFLTAEPIIKAPVAQFVASYYVRPEKNFNFLKKGKIVILVKIQNFSRSWMTKWTSPLESSREI